MIHSMSKFSSFLATTMAAAAVLTVLSSSSTHLVSASLSPEDVMGDWKLVELYDDRNQPVELPSSSEGFVLHLVKKEIKDEQDPEQQEGAKTLSLYTKIGNSMGGVLSLVDDSANLEKEQTIKVGPLRSTMMMPPPELFAVEQYLSKYLGAMKTLKLSDDGDELIWMGTGRIICQNVAKAAV